MLHQDSKRTTVFVNSQGSTMCVQMYIICMALVAAQALALNLKAPNRPPRATDPSTGQRAPGFSVSRTQRTRRARPRWRWSSIVSDANRLSEPVEMQQSPLPHHQPYVEADRAPRGEMTSDDMIDFLSQIADVDLIPGVDMTARELSDLAEHRGRHYDDSNSDFDFNSPRRAVRFSSNVDDAVEVRNARSRSDNQRYNSRAESRSFGESRESANSISQESFQSLQDLSLSSTGSGATPMADESFHVADWDYLLDFDGSHAESIPRPPTPPMGGVARDTGAGTGIGIVDDLDREAVRDAPITNRFEQNPQKLSKGVRIIFVR